MSYNQNPYYPYQYYINNASPEQLQGMQGSYPGSNMWGYAGPGMPMVNYDYFNPMANYSHQQGFQMNPGQWWAAGGDPSQYHDLYWREQQAGRGSLDTPTITNIANQKAEEFQKFLRGEGEWAGHFDGWVDQQRQNKINEGMDEAQADQWAANARSNPESVHNELLPALTPAQMERFRVTPQEYVQAGGDMRQYNELYGDTPEFWQNALPGSMPGQMDFMTSQGAINAQQGVNEYNLGLDLNTNRVSEQGPYGQSYYTQNPDGTWTRNYELSAPQQALLEQQQRSDYAAGEAAQRALGQAQQNMAQPFSYDQFGNVPQLNYSGLGNMPQLDYSNLSAMPGAGDFSEDRRRIEDTLYQNWERLNNPRLQEQLDAKKQEMVNRGLTQGSDRWNYELQQLSNQQSGERQGAFATTTELGGNEQQRLFGMGMGARQQGVTEAGNLYGAGMQNRQQQAAEAQNLYSAGMQTRGQQLSEYNQQRYAPIQEAQMYQGMQHGIVNPQFSAMYNAAPQPINAIGAGLGYNTLAQQMGIANMQDLTKRYGIDMNTALGYAQLDNNLELVGARGSWAQQLQDAQNAWQQGVWDRYGYQNPTNVQGGGGGGGGWENFIGPAAMASTMALGAK